MCKANIIGLAIKFIGGASVVACSKLREEDQLVLGLAGVRICCEGNLATKGAAPQLLFVAATIGGNHEPRAKDSRRCAMGVRQTEKCHFVRVLTTPT